MFPLERWQMAVVNETTATPTRVYLLDNRIVPFEYWWDTKVIEMCKLMGLLKPPAPTTESEAT